MSDSYLTQLEAAPESLPGEKWLPVDVGCEKASRLYLVSNRGRVLSRRRGGKKYYCDDSFKQFGWGLLKPSVGKRGYVSASLGSGDGTRRSFKVHRLVMLAHTPKSEHTLEVNHIDGDKTNNDITNLEWSTRIENVRHAFALGLVKSARGESSHASKLTDLQVKEIRGLRKAGIIQRRLADAYCVHLRNVRLIIARKTWKHLA